MVKVQKPTPKTLSKMGGVEKGVKKQKPDKTQLLKKGKNATGESAPKPAPEKKREKAKLIEKTLKEAQIVEPVKKGKNKEKVENKQQKQKSPQKPKQQAPKPAHPPKQQQDGKKKKGPQKAEKKPAKRPMVLAPPQSPAPVGEKIKNNKKKLPNVVAATTTAAAVAPKSKKQQKKQKPTAGAEGSAKGVALTKMQKKNATKKAFQRQQRNNKKAPKKAKKPIEIVFDQVPFDEEKFNTMVNEANIKEIAKGLKTLVEKEVAEKKSIFSDFRYLLNVASFKVPSCPKRMVKLNLKHSLVDKDDDIVIVVRDLQRGSKVDYEPTIQHYEDLFRAAGVEGLKIMPFNQLRTECNTFETVRKFGNTYDYFLCDGPLVGQTVGFCGKVFQKPRNTFHSVRMDNAKNLKNEIEKSLRRTSYKQLHKGDLVSIPVGNHKFTMQQLAENVVFVVSQLKKLHPGGLGNVRSMHLKIDIVGTSSLPLYMGIGQAPPAEVPYVVGPREQHMLKLRKDANEVLSKFNLNKEGDILKLNKKQVDQKRKVQELRATLLAAPQDSADDVVPAKRPRPDEKPESNKKTKSTEVVKSEVEKKEQVANDDEEEDDDDDDEDEDDDVNKADVDDDDEGDDDEDDGDVDDEDDDDDDEDDDDDDDDDGDDDDDNDDDEKDSEDGDDDDEGADDDDDE